MSVTPPLHSAPAPIDAAPQLAQKRRLPKIQELGLVVVTLILSLFLYIQAENISHDFFPKTIMTGGHQVDLPALHAEENKFLNANNLGQIVLTQMSWMAVMAIGLTFVIISGGIDISVGSVLGFTGLATAWALQETGERHFVWLDGMQVSSVHWVWWMQWAASIVHGLHSWLTPAPTWAELTLGICVPLGVGLLCGIINGSIVIGLRMHPFIVTLATMSIFRWACMKMTSEGTLPSGDHNLPDVFTHHFIGWQMNYSRYGGRMEATFQPVPVIIMLVCLALAWFYLRLMVWGRETYAIGGNEEAARFSGIRIHWAKMRVYAISGLCAGIAGMLNCGFYGTASTNTATGYELAVVAAAVVGGASLMGGRGTALGALLGTLVIQLIYDATRILNSVDLGFPPRNVMDLFGMSKAGQWFHFQLFPVKTEDSLLYNGVSIILAVAIDQFSQFLQQRRQKRAIK